MKRKPFSFFSFVLFALAGIALANVAHAGRYELIKGKGVEVCEAYKKTSSHSTNLGPWLASAESTRNLKILRNRCGRFGND